MKGGLENRIRERAGAIVQAASSRGLRITCAESCTGGLVAGALTAVAGASAVFPGAVVAYENSIKERLLSVSSGLLARFGAVSRECVLDMASGARVLFGADIAVAVSGIAGPGGGTPEKPVGTVWLAVGSDFCTEAHCCVFQGDRHSVREQAVSEALGMLSRALGCLA